MNATTQAAAAAQYLTFALAGEEFALPVLRVREILRYEELTRIPSAPPAVRGVLNLRGSVVPVVDLAVRFGLGETRIAPRTCVVIVETRAEGAAAVMGVLADAVSQVVELGADDIAPAPQLGTRVRLDYLAGMARLDGRFALLLDLDRVLSLDELEALAETGAVASHPGAPGAPGELRQPAADDAP